MKTKNFDSTIVRKDKNRVNFRLVPFIRNQIYDLYMTNIVSNRIMPMFVLRRGVFNRIMTFCTFDIYVFIIFIQC